MWPSHIMIIRNPLQIQGHMSIGSKRMKTRKISLTNGQASSSSFKVQIEQKDGGRMNSLSLCSWAGTSIFSCSWTLELLVPGPLDSDFGTYTIVPPQFLGLWPWTGSYPMASLVLRPLDVDRTVLPSFLVLKLAHGISQIL